MPMSKQVRILRLEQNGVGHPPADEELYTTEAQATPPTPTKPATFKGKVNKYAFIHWTNPFGRPGA